MLRQRQRQILRTNSIRRVVGGGAAPSVSIVSTNLIVHLDPRNVLSYPGSGTTWTNLVSGQPDYSISTTSLPAFTNDGSGITTFSYNSASQHNWTLNRPVQNDFSIGMWFKTTSTAGNSTNSLNSNPALIGGDWPGIAPDYTLSIANGVLQWGGLADVATRGSPGRNDGVWHYVVVTRTQSSGRMATYLDGSLDAEMLASPGSAVGRTPRIGIGADVINNQYFTGFIGAVHIYDRVLTNSEITQNYTALRESYGRAPSSVASGFNPPMYGALKLWLDATDVNGTGTNPANGTIVTTWKDKSGFANDATARGSPALAATGVNGKSGFYMNGTMGFYGTNINTGNLCTAFAVATLNSGCSTYGRLISLAKPTTDDISAGDRAIPFLRDSTNVQNISGYRANLWISTKRVPAYDAPFYASSIFDGTNHTIYINGSAGTVVANDGIFNITAYAIGYARVNNGDPWTGYISEILIYNSALSTTERQAVESYLATKWGI